MMAYRLFASAVSLWNYARGESPGQPRYVAGASKRVRRSLRDLGESFPYGWREIERGQFANALMVYAATIGEFHPLKPVIDSFLASRPGTPLVILSGQHQYIEAIRAAYPLAAVGIPPPCAPWLYDRLLALTSPRVLAIAEGPCLHLHFPIWFDLSLPAACLRHGTPMVVVNATTFPYLATSRLDKIEHRLYGSMHTDAVRYWYTQNEIFRSWLLAVGVPADRVVVTGDLRFDAQRAIGARSSDLTGLLASLSAAGVPIIVAGSVNAIDEESAVVDGWLEVRKKHAGARLIMAPRHVNNPENMSQLYEYLNARGVRYARRSEGVGPVAAAPVMVVDVFGELPHYYSIASVAYIGRNHTVLEPLRFKVPTVVAPRGDWAHDYVTFPAYKQLIDEHGIIEAPDKADLGQIFLKVIDTPDYGQISVSNALRLAEREKGAGKRIVEHIQSHVL